MMVEICPDIGSATRRLCRAKFEALVVDLKSPAETLELIKEPREMTSHQKVVVLAILNNNDDIPDAFRAGANFALVKPLLPAILIRTLKASYPLMVRERRRYYRHSVQTSIHVSSASLAEFVATSINISEGGMAITSSVALRVGETVTLKVTLPGTEQTATLNSEICWTDNAGRMGLVFVQVAAIEVERLQSWLADRLEESQPC